VAFDYFLYVALAVGWVAGRLLPHPGRWVPRATLVTVAVLVGFLGASLDSVPTTSLLATIPLALGFALLVLATTAAVYLLIARARGPRVDSGNRDAHEERIPLSFALLAALLAGYGLGRLVTFDAVTGITYALYVLLALVGFDLTIQRQGLGELWIPVTAAGIAAVVTGALFAVLSGTALSVSLATSLAFGWYSLAGPLVGARAGAVFGLLAFLTNFLREDLTMLLSPYVGRTLRGPGLAALGGATAMDTTLFFVTRYGDRDSGGIALASGLILTLAASLVLPAVLALPL
jgi:uncharacterized membrane protein YbjE (DUF340 family)